MSVRLLRVLAASLVLALTSPLSVAAADWHFTPTIGSTFFANTSLPDLDHGTGHVHRNFGASVAVVGGGILGAEGLFVWTPGFFAGDQKLNPLDGGQLVSKSRSLAFMGNVILTTPRRWTEYSLRPFLSGGFGMLSASRTEFKAVFPDARRMAAFNIGGGAVGFLSKRTGLRFDVRYYSNLHQRISEEDISFGRPHLRYMTATVGVVIRR